MILRVVKKLQLNYFWFLFFSFFLSLNTLAQVEDYGSYPVIDYSNPREYEIADITVSGIEFIEPMVLISISGLRVGDRITVPSDNMTRIIEKFWSQGLFSDVRLTATKIEAGKMFQLR